MAESEIKISALSNGNLTQGSLFVAADESEGTATGYASGKHSASDIGLGLLGDFQYTQQLNTTAKTIFGAINEIAQGGGGGGVQITKLQATLTAGNTSVTFTDNSIKSDSFIEVGTDVFGLDCTNVIADGTTHTCTVTFEAQQSDISVEMVVIN